MTEFRWKKFEMELSRCPTFVPWFISHNNFYERTLSFALTDHQLYRQNIH
jgi:hypothetical protein